MKRTTINKTTISRYWLTAACCALLWSGCSGDGTTESGGAMEIKKDSASSVTAFLLSKDRLSSAVTMPGELIPYQQVDIYAKVNGFIKNLYADVGTAVKAGQVLAVMEAPEMGSQLSGAASRLRAQEAIYEASKSNYDRLYETSKTPGTISPNDLDQAMARKNADSAQLQSSKSAFQETGHTQNYLTIRAPFAGVISARNVNPGAIAGPAGKGSDQPLFVLQDQQKLRLTVLIPESLTKYVHDHSQVTFAIKGLPNETFSATVSRSAGSLDSRLRSERVEMDILNKDRKLLPGMIAEVSIPATGTDSSFVVPKSAIVNTTEGIFVIKVSNRKAQWTAVTTGRTEGSKTEIFGLLAQKDTLLTSASEEQRNGSVLPAVTLEK